MSWYCTAPHCSHPSGNIPEHLTHETFTVFTFFLHLIFANPPQMCQLRRGLIIFWLRWNCLSANFTGPRVTKELWQDLGQQLHMMDLSSLNFGFITLALMWPPPYWQSGPLVYGKDPHGSSGPSQSARYSPGRQTVPPRYIQNTKAETPSP